VNSTLRSAGRVQRALIATALGVALGAGALVWTRTEILSLRYHLARLVDLEAALRAEVEKLAVEVAALSAPARIEKQARALGLGDPSPGQVVHPVRPGGDVAAGGPGK
jgi:cell division protein FtsL